MKKIILSIMLIFALLITTGVGIILAEDNITEVSNAQELVDALKSTGTVKLAQDIELSEKTTINSGVEITLDLNGKTLDLPNDSVTGYGYAMTVKGKLTITGNGTVDVNNTYGITTSTSGGDIVIKNGTFNGATAIYIIADYGGKVVIEDGTFNALYYAANGLDGYSKNPIEIKGGTFNRIDKTDADDQNVIAGNVKVSAGTFNRIIRGGNIASDADITIILEDDIDLGKLWRPSSEDETIVIPTGSKVKIDLNGHTILGEQKLFDVKGAELTVTGTGTIKEKSPNLAPIYVSGDSSTKTIVNIGENVTLEGWSGIMIPADAANAKGITINCDSKINAVNDVGGGTGIGIYINGGVTNKDIIDINLTPTTVINATGNGIYAAGYAEWKINGSKISGVESGLGIKAGSFNIDNATITGTGEDKTPTVGYGNGINPSGAAIQIESNHGYAGDINIDINGGKYESKNGIAFYEYLGKYNKVDTTETEVSSLNIKSGEFISAENKPAFAVSDNFKVKVTKFITGGTFTSDVTDYIADGFLCNKVDKLYKVAKPTQEAEVPNNVIDAKNVEKMLIETLKDEIAKDEKLADKVEGKNIEVEVKLSDKEIDEAEKEKIEKEIKDATIVKYIDITIVVKDADTGDKLAELETVKKAITFTVAIPTDLPDVAEGFTRVFYIIREHDGKVELLETKLEDGKLVFESDKFSTYAIAYKDVENSVEGEVESEPVVDTETSDIPQTGDNVVTYIVLAAVAMIGIVAFKKIKKSNGKH